MCLWQRPGVFLVMGGAHGLGRWGGEHLSQRTPWRQSGADRPVSPASSRAHLLTALAVPSALWGRFPPRLS